MVPGRVGVVRADVHLGDGPFLLLTGTYIVHFFMNLHLLFRRFMLNLMRLDDFRLIAFRLKGIVKQFLLKLV